jgi:tetratricopeptide (TPR) repeat protein
MAQTMLTNLRILIVSDSPEPQQKLLDQLQDRGFQVSTAGNASDAIRASREAGVQAVVLALPFGDVDPVALCATLKEGPGAPAVVVADALDHAQVIETSLPHEMQPDAIMSGPLEASNLSIQLEELTQPPSSVAHAEASSITFPELLLELHAAKESGLLEIQGPGVRTGIQLSDGSPVFAEGGSLQQTLGRMLVRKRKIQSEEYARVIERMTERLIEQESVRLGEVLVELGLLSSNEVFDALKTQVREKIIECFQWKRFDHHFTESDGSPGRSQSYRCPSVQALVLEGVRTHFGPERLEPLLKVHENHYPKLEGDFQEVARVFRLTRSERQLLRAMDGRRTSSMLRSASTLDPVHTDQLLAALNFARALVWRSDPAQKPSVGARRSRSMPASPRAGSTPNPEVDARKTSLQHDPRAQLRQRIALIKRRAASHKEAQSGADGTRARLEAERLFNQGLHLLADGINARALENFRRAAELQPREPEYLLLEAWTEYLSLRSYDARVLAKSKALACARRVLEAANKSARAHSILGQIYLADGNEELAERHLRMAVQADPKDPAANRGLRLLASRAQS